MKTVSAPSRLGTPLFTVHVLDSDSLLLAKAFKNNANGLQAAKSTRQHSEGMFILFAFLLELTVLHLDNSMVRRGAQGAGVKGSQRSQGKYYSCRKCTCLGVVEG